MMQDIEELQYERNVECYGEPTPAQLARAALRIEEACREFVMYAKRADDAIGSDELNIPDPPGFKKAYKSLADAAAEIRTWLEENGYSDQVVTEEEGIQRVEEMIGRLHNKIAGLRNKLTFSGLASAWTQFRDPCKALSECADAAIRRREQIRSAERFKKACKALYTVVAENQGWKHKSC